MHDVCVVGSANLDLVATASRLPGPGETVLGRDFHEHPGGKGLNQAIAAARAGSSVSFVGALGRDPVGDRLLAILEAEHIDARHVARVDEPTGRALIGVDDNGENAIIVVPGANASVTAMSTPSARVVLAQLEVPIAAVVAAMTAGRARGAITVLNPAPAQRLDARLLALCDVVVPNEHEVALLGGADHLLALGASAVIVTLGAAGAQLHSPTGVATLPAFAVTAIDTTAAGDAFCGALCTGLAAGAAVEEASRFAAAAGALATTRAGAVPSLPTRSEIEELLSAAG